MVGRPDNRHVLMGDKKLLYRTTKISGLAVYQLVIPKEKREMLISMAHETEFAGHIGTNKTAKRLQVHFWWPKLRAMVAKFIKSCESCQLIARKTKLDRTPIVPFPRTQRAWSQASMDVLGPVRKNSSAQPFHVLDQQKEKKSVKDYMIDLKQDLEIEAKVAEDNCTVRQKKYIDKYNEKTQNKSFEIGENLLVLMKDVTNKVLAKWIGPLIVTAKLAKNNYRVANKDGTTRKLHADDLRKWTARTASIGIVYEVEDEFGDIEACPTKAVITDSEQEINNLDLSYLSESRGKQMIDLLLKYKDVFSNQPGTCNILEHKINLVDGYRPHFSKPYRVPEKCGLYPSTRFILDRKSTRLNSSH